jgi:phosphatidylserine/phosphatidylglycerophosphate/cardiolipin synthase-like enzyme
MVRRYCCGFACVISLWMGFGLPARAYEAALPVPAQGTLQAAFSPWDDVEGLIVGALADAHGEILMQAYLLTSKKIVGALRQAQQRGVTVKILLDAAQVAAMPVAQKQQAILRNDGIAVWGETNYTNAHNKVIVIDAETADATLITGSYNFTWSAQHKNAENILIVRGNPQLTGLYAANWERHRRDAVSYE